MYPLQRSLLLLFSLSALISQAVVGADIANECATMQPGWIWCEDFEQDRSADYFEGNADRQTGTGVNDSIGAAFLFAKNAAGAGGLKVAFGRTPDNYIKPVDSGTQDYREIYWRMYLYHPKTWVGGGADKLSRATILTDNHWTQAMIAHVWSGADPGNRAKFLLIDPASGTDTAGNIITKGYNDFTNLRWLGNKASQYPIFAQQNFGQWQCIEARVKLNQPGHSDGVFQMFINDRLEVESTTLNWIGSYSNYGINAVFFENHWNNGSPVAQTRYFDNLVISTQRIGCGSINGTPTFPPPP